MANVRILEDKEGNQFFPLTHTKAVVNDSGTNVETLLAAKQDSAQMATINGSRIDQGGNVTIVAAEGQTITIDAVPTAGSSNPVSSGGVYDAVNKLGQDFNEFTGGSTDVTDTLVFEQGGIGSVDGSNQTSQQQIRSNFIPAKSVTVSVTNGSVYVYGWADSTYKGAQGWKTGNDNTVEIAGANKYKVVFKKSSGSLSPSGFPDLGATVMANYSAEIVKVTPQSLTEVEKQQARTNIDALPTSAEASIKAYSDATLLLNANKVAGKGETVVSVALVLMPETRYKFNIPNPSWAYSGSQIKLQLKVTGGNQLFAYTGQQEVPQFIYFVTGIYTDFTLFVRANTGTDFTYTIENVNEVDRQILMGVKPYFTPSRIDGGWRIVINPSTSLFPNWKQDNYTPSGATFDFTDSDKLLVYNQISNEYALRDSTILHGDTVLLDYRGRAQNFVGGLFFPYFIQYGVLDYPEYATASGFDIDENGKVSWNSLSLHKKDNTVATFTADSFVISSSFPALVFRSATGQIVTTSIANINEFDSILLALNDGMYFGMLAYLVEKKKLTSWYADEYELNIKRFGDQLKNVKWTPKADVRSNEGLNEAGVEVTGVPYSSVKEELKFVGVDVSLHTFMTAINDIHSLMYTENVSANGSRSAYGKTYHGVNSICYFGSVCSGFVTTAIGGLVQFNSWEYQTYPERFHIIEEQDEQNLKVGDIISEPGHCAIVTRLYRTLAGKITDIEVSEHGAPLRTTTYRLQSLIDRRRQTGIVYCRMNNRSWIDKYITYTPSPFVLADGEMLYTGGDFVYRDGVTRTFYRCTQQNMDSSFVNAKWQSVPVFATGTEIPVNNYRQYGERLYRCKVTHTPTEWDADKWEYVKGVKEWASYPYTYNDDIVTFAGDRAAFRFGEDIYLNFTKGSYTKMQVYKEGTLLDELTLGDGYQLDITSLIVSPGLYKARLSDGTNFSRYTYFEVIDATVTATIENGVATVNYSSNYGTPLDVQIVELSGFPIYHFAVDGGGTIKIDPQAGLYRQRHHYYERYNNYSQTVYARVVFAGEYGNIASEMVSIGTLEPITGILVYPNETLDLGRLSGANNIIITDGLVGKRYDFSFVATSGSSIVLRSVLGSLKWADSVPTLQAEETYIFSVVNGIVRYEII